MYSWCRCEGRSQPAAIAVAGVHPSAHVLPLVFISRLSGRRSSYALRERVVRTCGQLGRARLWRVVRRNCAPRVVVAQAAIAGGAYLPWSGRNECGLPSHGAEHVVRGRCFVAATTPAMVAPGPGGASSRLMLCYHRCGTTALSSEAGARRSRTRRPRFVVDRRRGDDS